MAKLDLIWMKCQGNVWCNLNNVNLTHAHFENMHGVYIIWHGGSNPATVYVGNGFIRDKLMLDRFDPKFHSYAPHGLYVTWAQVPKESIAGVSLYLERKLSPKITDIYPGVEPIEVNSPW